MENAARRGRVTFANITSCLALLVALGGTAQAAGLIDGGDVKNGSLTGKDVKNGSLTGKDVRNGSVRSADLAPGVAPGTELAPGTMLRGVFAPGSGSPTPGNSSASQGVTFTQPLASAPRAHVMPPEADPTSDCPGTLIDPRAASGQLCLYVRFVYPSATQVVVTAADYSDPDIRGVNYNLGSDSETVFGDGTVSRFGFRVAVVSTSNVAQLEGTWAVGGD